MATRRAPDSRVTCANTGASGSRDQHGCTPVAARPVNRSFNPRPRLQLHLRLRRSPRPSRQLESQIGAAGCLMALSSMWGHAVGIGTMEAMRARIAQAGAFGCLPHLGSTLLTAAVAAHPSCRPPNRSPAALTGVSGCLGKHGRRPQNAHCATQISARRKALSRFCLETFGWPRGKHYNREERFNLSVETQ